MKKILILIFTIFSVNVNAQIFTPVSWTFSHEMLSDNEFELSFTANIDEGWYIYSQSLADDGPVPTEFTFQKTNNYKLLGDVIEEKAKEEYDPNFDMMLKFFKDKTTFKQRVLVEDMSQTITIKGEIYYMTCDDKQCLPPELVEFSFDLNVDKDLKSNNDIIKKSNNSDSDSK